MAAWLDGPLWLPFLEPSVLHHHLPLDPRSLPRFDFEDRAENLQLACLWSTQSLLALRPGNPPVSGRCRVFNAYKNLLRDRQIGDRRWGNSAEMHLAGPSADLPAGSALLCLEVPRFTHKAVGFISDRRDFYHQAAVSWERAQTNALPFGYTAQELAAAGVARPVADLVGGDDASFAGVAHRGGILAPSQVYTPCFASLFQGDHHGVEFALEAHSQMLTAGGALHDGLLLRNRGPPPLGPDVQALVIDDFVCVSVVPAGHDGSHCPAAALHAKAQETYARLEVEGSPDKDVVAADRFQAIGAELGYNCFWPAAPRGPSF